MIPEVGHLALWLAVFFALGLTALPALGVFRNDYALMSHANTFAIGQFIFAGIAFCALGWAFATDDFSVAYVAANSNSMLPVEYKLSALWGAHEGSFLLWVLIMCVWTLAVAARSHSLPPDIRAALLSVMGALSLGFMLFSLTTSNPFERLLPFSPLDGADLNPQLQDPGLIIHPPMLYVGYIGFSVVFAFAVAVLWRGRLDVTLLRWLKPWVSVAWAFLGLGIVLGSWWAYNELGWGGWWFWDAVENASFLPWLAGAALLHSLVATEKRGVFKRWTLLLALMTFTLSLLGAFLVRSGVLTSVHSFAVDPARGLFILAFMVLVVGGSLILYAFRVPRLVSVTDHSGWSRETFLLTNNLLLMVATGTILLGTLFPLAYEAFSGGQKISVGPPYFNKVFVPLMALLAVAMGLGVLTRWRHHPWMLLLKQARWLFVISLAFGCLVPWMITGAWNWQVSLATVLASWVLSSLLGTLVMRFWRGSQWRRALNLPYCGMWLGHLGFAVTLMGVVISSHFTEQKNLVMVPGQAVNIGNEHLTLQGVSRLKGANYLAERAVIEVSSGSPPRQIFYMMPEKRHYPVRATSMTEAAVEVGFWRDLYVVLGVASQETEGAWSMRIQHKPFIRWIWFGGMLMAAGALIAVLGKGYRTSRPDEAAPPEHAPAEGGQP